MPVPGEPLAAPPLPAAEDVDRGRLFPEGPLGLHDGGTRREIGAQVRMSTRRIRIAEGRTSHQIATATGRGYSTVRSHL